MMWSHASIGSCLEQILQDEGKEDQGEAGKECIHEEVVERRRSAM